ncbi:Bromodomain-containing protein [Testicularia cyperi]|uniref:Bromodomain-containing protein n=1 Tax=Testicularia cyperi TaxID=1882483 RepID=A0A317XIR6_9BASI|nr:Bromodomain-containing protein [Testicularia cyperi]
MSDSQLGFSQVNGQTSNTAAPAPTKTEPGQVGTQTSSAPVVPPTAESLASAGVHPDGIIADLRAKTESSASVNSQSGSALADGRPYNGPMEVTAAQLKFAQSTLKSLKSRRESAAFLRPVDPIALNVPQYPQIITKPMDFGTIDIKLALTAQALRPNSKPGEKAKQAAQWNLDPSKDVYRRIQDFEADVRQVFVNCATFNGPDSPYTENARVLELAFEKYMKDVPSATAAPATSESGEVRARRPSNPVPTIRRSSADAGGRPKREIHPPPPKDLPWSNEPQSASASEMTKAARRKGAKKGMTAREQAYWAKVAQDEIRFCSRIIDDLLKPTHQNVAWVFYDVPTMDYDWAPAYFQMIKKPISLRQIQTNVKTGKYADADEFNTDMELLFQNCYTFNPPDSDVHGMGRALQKVYEDKMQKKPVPPPMLPDYEESDVDEEEEEDEEDDVDPEFLATLQEQISGLAATLATLEGAKNQNAGLIANTKAMLASLQESYATSGGSSKKPKAKNGAGTKRKANDGAAAAKKKSKAKSAGSPSNAASAEYVPSKKAKTAPKKKAQPPSSTSSKKAISNKRGDNSDEDIRTVTYEQKEELAAKITELSEERLDGAIRIINEDKPPNQNDDEEIELDIDELSPRTLYKLYKYVVRPKKVPQPANKGNSKSAPLDGRKRGTGGIKKKNLDEGEEAERIARLQQQLEQFGNPEALGGAGAQARGHDDLVHSESSSDESGSDSDSD